jgi:hypothetical protein
MPFAVKTSRLATARRGVHFRTKPLTHGRDVTGAFLEARHSIDSHSSVMNLFTSDRPLCVPRGATVSDSAVALWPDFGAHETFDLGRLANEATSPASDGCGRRPDRPRGIPSRISRLMAKSIGYGIRVGP